MELHAVAGVSGETVRLAEGVRAAEDALPVAGQAFVEDAAEIPGGRVVFGILEAVVSKNVNRVVPHLGEDATAAPGAYHEEASRAADGVECGARLGGERGLVLRQRAVEIEGDEFDSGGVHVFTWRTPCS